MLHLVGATTTVYGILMQTEMNHDILVLIKQHTWGEENAVSSFVSIRSKLITKTMLLIGISFLILLSVIFSANIINVQKNADKSKLQIRNALIAKGKLLARNNSFTMNVMARDNAFTAIQELVSSTVAADDDLVYGIYMDAERKAWVLADSDNPEGIPKQFKPLSDSLSLWVQSLTTLSYKEYNNDSSTIIEFAAPVGTSDETLGYIRYGLSTASMKRTISAVLADSRIAMMQTIIFIVATGLFSLLLGYLMLKQLASRITLPIGSLGESARIITEGNYDVPVVSTSNDEIGNLAEHFESMRRTIKQYTDHLQVLIDIKMQQVKDILNNIDQGLFTVNPDGTINEEYSIRANEILMVDNVASCTLRELFRYDSKTDTAFKAWFDLVGKQHRNVRWSKLARLAPVRDLVLTGSDEKKYISIDYQKIREKSGELAKIMVLTIDETDKRNRELQINEERRQHEFEVATILSIVHTPAEELTEFVTDTKSRLAYIREKTGRLLAVVTHHRDNYPDAKEYIITKKQIDRLYRNLHTIKGNSGSYNFDRLAFFSHEAENVLELLHKPMGIRREDTLKELLEKYKKMETVFLDIQRKISLILGNDDDFSQRIPKTLVKNIVGLGKEILSTTDDLQVRRLAGACAALDWRPAKSILRKYTKLAKKISRKLNKKVEVVINDENVLHPPEFVSGLDDVLIHLVRNAVAHGIESPEVREELGKSDGRISFHLMQKDGMRKVMIADDGQGIMVDKIVNTAVDSGYISNEEAKRLSREDKIKLLYLGGITTSETISDISGRGVGMQIIYRQVLSLQGTLTIQTEPGKGTTFTIEVPDKKRNSHSIEQTDN